MRPVSSCPSLSSCIPLLIAGVTTATVVLTIYCLSVGINTVFMHLYYLPIILIAYFYRRRGIPVLTGLSLFYLAVATFFLYPSSVEIESAILRAAMFILIGVIVAELSERLEKKKEEYRLADEYEKSIIDNANVWLMVLGSHGIVLEWNHAAEQISGYPAAEVIGRNEVWKHLYPDEAYRKEINEKIAAIIKQNRPLENLQTTIVNRSGTNRTIVWNTRDLPASRSGVGNYIAIGIDITDREKVIQISCEYAEWYSTILRTTRDGYNLFDSTGKLIEVNDNYCRMTGFSREELLGISISDQDANENKEFALAHFRTILATGSDRFETRHRTKNGGAVDVEISAVLQAHKQQFIVFVRDITERKRAEMELSFSEEKFRAFFATSLDCVFITSPDGQWIDLNDAAVELFGYGSREELMQVNVRDLYVNPDERARINAVIRQEGFAKEIPVDLKKKDGTVINALITSVVKRNKNGIITGYQGTIRDVTGQKQMESALRESQIKLAESMDLAHLVNWEFDVITGLFTFNDRFYALYGTTAEREGGYIMPAAVYAKEFVHPDDAYLVSVEIGNAIAATDPDYTRQIEHRIIRRDGEVRHIIVRFGITKDAGGRTVKTHGANQDITERRRAEQQVEEKSRFLATLIETLPVPLFYKDINGKYLGCNSPFEEYIGIPRNELVGKTVFDISPRDLAETYREADQQLFDNPVPQRYETQIRYASGSRHDVIFYKAPFFNNDGSVGGLIGTFLDITELKLAEDALQQANKKLNLLSSITRHDINNQLTVLLGYLELSKDSLGDIAMQSEYIVKEQQAADAIRRQIIFTKEYQDLGVNAPVWQNVEGTIKKSLIMLPIRDIRVIPEVSDLEVFADPLFERVFYNLIDNALRYGGPKMTRIRITSKEAGQELVISVEDDGAGISSEDKKSLFTRGFGHNTGLGLFLSREILAITGITITENGEPGSGARFEIRVPVGKWRSTTK